MQAIRGKCSISLARQGRSDLCVAVRVFSSKKSDKNDKNNDDNASKQQQKKPADEPKSQPHNVPKKLWTPPIDSDRSKYILIYVDYFIL